MLRNKQIFGKRIAIIFFLLSVNSILQVDAYLLHMNNITLPAWIVTGCSFLVVILILIFNPKFRYIFTEINKDNILIGICILTFYLCHIPGLIIFSGNTYSNREYFYWLYSIILFSFGGLIGEYFRKNVQHLSVLILLILISLLVIDLTIFSFSPFITNRAEATLRNPNDAAFVVVALMVSSLQDPLWKIKSQNVLILIISAIGIVLTASIGGAWTYISVLVLLVFLSFIKGQIKLKKIIIFFPFIIVLAAASVNFVLYNKFGLSIKNLDMGIILSSQNMLARLEAARAALKLFSERPIFGHGLAYVHNLDLGPHNMLLRILVEGGLLGFVGLCVLIGGFLIVAYKRNNYKLFVLTIALMAIGMTTHNLLEMRSVVFITGMIFAASRFN